MSATQDEKTTAGAESPIEAIVELVKENGRAQSEIDEVGPETADRPHLEIVNEGVSA